MTYKDSPKIGLSKLWKDGDDEDKKEAPIQGTPFRFEKIVKASQVSQNATVLQTMNNLTSLFEGRMVNVSFTVNGIVSINIWASTQVSTVKLSVATIKTKKSPQNWGMALQLDIN